MIFSLQGAKEYPRLNLCGKVALEQFYRTSTTQIPEKGVFRNKKAPPLKKLY
jgi:hypothetical protein